jgi:hypothetical protein
MNYPLVGIQALLQWLDRLITSAIEKAQMTYGTDLASDPHRGLYIDEVEIKRLLEREPGNPLFQIQLPPDWQCHLPLVCLKQANNLSDFEVGIILIALAPEIDLRYERLYAYLQDDVTRKRPTVDLILNLLCNSSSEKLQCRQYFMAHAPLVQSQIIHLISELHQVEPPLLAYGLKLDAQIIQFLLGDPNLDYRLIPFCDLIYPPIDTDEGSLIPEFQHFVQPLLKSDQTNREPLKLYLQGVPGIGKSQIAMAIAAELQAPLLIADLSQAFFLKIDIPLLINLILREAQLKQAVLYLPGVDYRQGDQQGVWSPLLLKKMIQHCGIATIFSGNQLWATDIIELSSVISIRLELPDFEQRKSYWQSALSSNGYALEASDIELLANQFRLTPEQIKAAVNQAGNFVEAGRVGVSISEQSGHDKQASHFLAAARKQSGQELQFLAQKIQPHYRWEDIVLPPDVKTQLQELCSQVKYRQVVYQSWGFERKLSLGKGVIALFSGPPGTGKTMAAEVVAQDLQLDLYRIDLSQVVSKYIGETEKNLDRIFTAAETANAILFFDEADALFGKRSEVKDAHDRYANIEVGYLLQKVEAYSGLAILASNLRQNLDDAFIRRLQFIVEFPFPDELYRQQIWKVLFPPTAPLDQSIDMELLAREIRLPGGSLKNIALAAAFYAAAGSGVIQMAHIMQAAQREHQKIGRTWQVVDFND